MKAPTGSEPCSGEMNKTPEVDRAIAQIGQMAVRIDPETSARMLEIYGNHRDGWADIIQANYDRLYQVISWSAALPLAAFAVDAKSIGFLGSNANLKAFSILLLLSSLVSCAICYQFWSRASRAVRSYAAFERAAALLLPELRDAELLKAAHQDHKNYLKRRWKRFPWLNRPLRQLARNQNWWLVPLALGILGGISLALVALAGAD